jgi:cytochrome c oxidase cbb3-type subunit 2
MLFLGLVWIDSAAFFIIQHSPHLKANTWEGMLSLQGNVFVHLCTAVLSGIALDRSQQAFALGVALLALLGACLLLTGAEQHSLAARICYTSGVSIYSTALVFYPAGSGRPWLAGLIFAASGWFGSAAGIGMAQSLHAIPRLFVIVVASAATVLFSLRYFWLKRMQIVQGMLTLSALGFLFHPKAAQAAEDPEIRLGREVYIGEGCIHCHSQYVRPITSDVERWGPSTPLTESLPQQPPLYGNRRQGPDLAQVANRRTPEWNRLHLIAPRTITPGSRMPSYAYLFQASDPRGDALVAYLATLGAENIPARMQAAQSWRPAVDTSVLPDKTQQKLFAKLCAACHGVDGQGNGPLTDKLSLRPPDFMRDAWRHISERDPQLELARIIKFGQPGTPMAGHEYLSDQEIVSLAEYVLNLHRKP